ncbi:hypothetical protein GDO81_022750 [Engystomops pustulosus]|uniref:Uncharacterized protein n=1 Tax=Engystomops pustulosus TaxID=76066 RepID=A0AAV6YWL0_ENGPU|nr:hypothetical protein GDO81_022750 [Engystomops pustulosus]
MTPLYSVDTCWMSFTVKSLGGMEGVVQVFFFFFSLFGELLMKIAYKPVRKMCVILCVNSPHPYVNKFLYFIAIEQFRRESSLRYYVYFAK